MLSRIWYQRIAPGQMVLRYGTARFCPRFGAGEGNAAPHSAYRRIGTRTRSAHHRANYSSRDGCTGHDCRP